MAVERRLLYAVCVVRQRAEQSIMAKAKRKKKPSKQQFVVAKLNDDTVIAGWCLSIKNKKLAKRVGEMRSSGRDVVKLPVAFATVGEEKFANALGVFISIGVRL